MQLPIMALHGGYGIETSVGLRAWRELPYADVA